MLALLNSFDDIVLNAHTRMNSFKHHGMPLVTTSFYPVDIFQMFTEYLPKLSYVLDAISGHVGHAINGKKN